MSPDVLADLVLARAHPAETGPTGEQCWRAGSDLLLRLWPDGTQKWYRDGQLHRDGDQPAVVYVSGTQYWYRDGRRHRDGNRPAVVGTSGSQEWWVNGRKI